MPDVTGGAMSVGTRAERATTLAVLGAASVFFALSAYNIASVAINAREKGKGKSKSTEERVSGAARPEPRQPSDSAVANVTYVTTPEDCQATSVAAFPHTGVRPKIHAGALFKLIDVAAGVAARRHARGPCVTISVDSVLLLKPIFLGDVVHVSASVNRAWTTSMEVGVRIVKETASSDGPRYEYISHSYLTFVALSKDRSSNALKPILAPIKTTSRLESRRHMLAGRRRNTRLEDTKRGVSRDAVSLQVKRQVREEVLTLLRDRDAGLSQGQALTAEEAAEREKHLRMVEIETLIRAWAQGEPGIAIWDGVVAATQEGDEPLRFPEDEVRRRARELGVRLPGDDNMAREEQSSSEVHRADTSLRPSLVSNHDRFVSASDTTLAAPSAAPLSIQDTLTSTMHLVFPQHTNSHGIIFGGNTMSWSEDVAIMACRGLKLQRADGELVHGSTWKTVAMDGLEFAVRVGVGELMIFAAVVLRTFARSCEVYVLALAENHEGDRRVTNDVLFTMACDDAAPEVVTQKYSNTLEKARIATPIVMPAGSALETYAAAGDARRTQRLQLRDMLVRVYGS